MTQQLINTLKTRNNIDYFWGKLPIVTVIKTLKDYHYFDLFAEEATLISQACKKRIVEFSTGRVCAHQGMENLGEIKKAVLISDDRSPIWPKNITGSISHAGTLAVAVVSKDKYIKSLGIDIEIVNRIKYKIWKNIFVSDEIKYLKNNFDVRVASLIFSIKEAFYKCQYSLTKEHVGFKDVRVQLNLIENTWVLIVLKKYLKICLLDNKDYFKGRFQFIDNYILSGIVI